MRKTQKTKRVFFKPRTSAAAGLLALGMAGLTMYACNVSEPDFSAWNGTNLIPGFGFDSLSWIPDGDADADADGLADSRSLDSAGDYSDTYLSLTRVDTLTAGTPSGRYDSTYMGFASATDSTVSTDLYYGISSNALLSNGGKPPVYRLEVKNLFIDGDFESSAALSGGYSIFKSISSTSPYTIKSADDNTTNTGLARSGVLLKTYLNSTDRLDIDFSTLVSDYSATGTQNYNMNFIIRVNNAKSFTCSWDPDDTDQPYDISYVVVNDTAPDADTYVRFPYGTSSSSNPVITKIDAQKTFRMNSRTNANSPGTPLQCLWLDDIQVVRLDKALGLRLQVPYKLLSGSSALRPELMGGGTYTLTFEVRRDPTVAVESTRRLNSFAAEYLSVSVQDYSSTPSQENPSTSVVYADTSDWDNWTTITTSFTDLLASTDLSSAADDDKLLEIFISPCDVTHSLYTTPGSLLVTAPRLTWSQN